MLRVVTIDMMQPWYFKSIHTGQKLTPWSSKTRSRYVETPSHKSEMKVKSDFLSKYMFRRLCIDWRGRLFAFRMEDMQIWATSKLWNMDLLHGDWMYGGCISGWDLRAYLAICYSLLLLPLSIGWKYGYVTRKGFTEQSGCWWEEVYGSTPQSIHSWDPATTLAQLVNISEVVPLIAYYSKGGTIWSKVDYCFYLINISSIA